METRRLHAPAPTTAPATVRDFRAAALGTVVVSMVLTLFICWLTVNIYRPPTTPPRSFAVVSPDGKNRIILSAADTGVGIFTVVGDKLEVENNHDRILALEKYVDDLRRAEHDRRSREPVEDADGR